MAGHVRKRGDKWYYSFEASSVDGKRKRIERVGGKTKKEAEAELRKALTEYENAGLHFEPSEMSFSDYLDYWFENYVLTNCKANTQNGYGLIIENHLKPSLGSYKLKALTPSVLQEFINAKYIYGYSKNHLSGMKNVLNVSFKHAVYPYNFRKDNPMQYVSLPKYDHKALTKKHKIISQNDFNTIIERFHENTSFYIMLLIGFYTGTRISEATALTWEDVNFDACTISINKIIIKNKTEWYFGSTKTKSSVRTIKVGSALLNILKQHKRRQAECRLKYGEYYTQQYRKNDHIYSLPLHLATNTIDTPVNFICTKENGELVTSETFKYASRVIKYELGIKFNYHSLRHTHATMLIENGANIKDVQERLGHSNLATTMDTYAHVTNKMQTETADLFDKIAKLPTE